VAAIRNWLRSAPRLERRIGPFPGNRRILASFRLTASRAFYAISKHAGSRIQLNFRHLPEGTCIAGLLTVRVTHLAKNSLTMRHPIPAHVRNQLKIRSLKPRD
jgi:hypothetical protein